MRSGDMEDMWGETYTSNPAPASYPGVTALQGALLEDNGLPWVPRPVPGCGRHHSPSGRVNSRKVGSDTTVWEMVCTGSNMQVTSLGRQDLTQRTVSVFSWRSLRGTRTQEVDELVGASTATETGVQGGATGGPVRAQLAPRRPQRRAVVASTARLLRGDASGPFLNTGLGPTCHRRTPVSVGAGCAEARLCYLPTV